MALDGFDYAVPWSMFQKLKARPAGEDADGYTSAKYRYKNVKPARSKNATVVKSADVIISMNTHESWVVSSQMNSYLLKHEQGHYDITALGARELYRGLLKLNVADIDALNASMEELNDTVQKKIDSANSRYDDQTDHSRNKTEQDKWNKAIANEKQKQDGSIDNLP
jgi:hypothetical protein